MLYWRGVAGRFARPLELPPVLSPLFADSPPWAQTNALIATYRLHPDSKTVAQSTGFYADWLAIVETYFAHPGVPPAEQAPRPAILADIYAAMANLEAQGGGLAAATRYAAYALTLAGPRKRMLKLPLALLDRVLPLGLATRAMELWGWALRARGRP